MTARCVVTTMGAKSRRTHSTPLRYVLGGRPGRQSFPQYLFFLSSRKGGSKALSYSMRMGGRNCLVISFAIMVPTSCALVTSSLLVGASQMSRLRRMKQESVSP
mgnify:CR=1 FL=1